MNDSTSGPAPRHDTPVLHGERIVALDVLRGAALLGIFIMNMPGFTHSLFARPVAPTAALDIVAMALREVFFAGKFNLLFGLLFGIGFTLQLARLERAEPKRAVTVYARRLAALMAIGLVHAVLLWPGDVLVVYAVLGFGLLALRRIPDRGLVALIVLCLAYPALSESLRTWWMPVDMETLAAFDYSAFEVSNDLAFGHGSFADAVVETARVFAWSYSTPLGLFSYAAFYVQMATGILAGVLAGRRGWLEAMPRRLATLRRAQWVALAVVLAAAVVAVSLGSLLAQTIGRAALTACYVLVVLRLLARPGSCRGLLVLAPAGRMPLSNYLLQTLLASAIFYGWGLGWWGRAGAAMETSLAVLLFFLVQLPLSAWWLRRFRHGPAEYFWRVLTYGRRAV